MAEEVHIPDKLWFVGKDINFIFRIYQLDGVTPQDITGWGLEFVVKRWVDDTNPLIAKTTDDDITLTTPVTGYLRVSIVSADTLGSPHFFRSGLYRFALSRTDPGSQIVLTEGTVPIRRVASQ